MRRMSLTWGGAAAALAVLALVAVPSAAQPGGGTSAAGRTPLVTISNCVVSEIAGPRVAAEEQGVLLEVLATPGKTVRQGDLLARLDDHRAQLVKRNTEIDLEVARYQAGNDINVRYAAAAAQVAATEHRLAAEANQGVSGAVSQTEIRRLELEARRAGLGIEQAQMEQKVQQFQADKARAELDAAEDNLRRRRIVSPIDGVVMEVEVEAGEWVNPGNTICQVVRMDRLQVQGFININTVSPATIVGRPVSLEVQIAGRTERFEGQIVHVTPRALSGGQVRIRAEVDNRMQNDQWLLLPGLGANMTVY